ncbi:MAG TPA: FKBP-type peptidyl-prolyl cis-trans isomerase [Leucothrix sp.]|nr:FKBP-type peptidyl-prolyl cis-trans isomerase [Leucothrix sp.]
MKHTFTKILSLALIVFLGTTTVINADTATNKKEDKVAVAPTSLVKNDVKVGKGVEAKAGQQVSVHYTGWLFDPKASDFHGKQFDSSRTRGTAFKFPLGAGRVIKGWDQGVEGMKVGGQRTLTIPAALGYGARGAGGVIPPNATLVFDVELMGVE